MIGNARRKQNSTKVNYSQSSPTKASVLIQTDCTEYVHELQAKKQNTQECLKLYQTKYEGNQPQKCIKHIEDYISLYCQQEKKLMCVSCLYASTQHKNHNVVPLNTSWQSIEADNEESIIFLNDECQKLKKTQGELQQNFKTLEKEYESIVRDMEKQFNNIHRMIDQKHEELKDKVISWFSQSLKNTQISIKEISWRKSYFYDIRSSFPKKDSSNHEAEVYKHLVMELLMSEPIDSGKLTYLASNEEMNEEFLNEVKEIYSLLEKQIDLRQVETSQRSSERKKY